MPMFQKAELNGLSVAYAEAGSGTRPLVLLHGFTGSKLDFAPRLAELAKTGRVLIPDLRGHGDSSNTGDARGYSLGQCASDLLGFLAKLDIKECDLLGHSMGGMVALRAVLADPQRIGSLILMDTAARPPDGIRRETLEVGGQVARAVGMGRLAEILREHAANDEHRTVADRRLQVELGDAYWETWRYPNYRSMDPIAFGAFGAAMFDQPPLLDRLTEIACPTLVMVGDGDTGFLASSEELARGIPGAKVAMIPNAGHQPQLENPDAWLDAIRAHLAFVRNGTGES
jgi:pimeloyl-ACP methyl ester carboxylesterase